jgi:hypothetical protein
VKRLRLSRDQRRWLAVKGRILGRKWLRETGTLFTPDTILRWHRTLLAQEWDYRQRRKSPRRPRVRQETVDLVLRLAQENVSWGYDKIRGAPANLGHKISAQTVGKILRDKGIEPASDRRRQTTCKSFIRAHGNAVRQFLADYHAERNHRGLANRLIDPAKEVRQSRGEVQCRERLGSLLRYYYRHAARGRSSQASRAESWDRATP